MRGIIYCIKEKEKGYDSPIYIGSTKDFNMRKGTHKTICHKSDIKLYQYIRENGGWDNFEMLEIGVVEYEKNEQLKIEEQKWIDDLGATLNDIKAYITTEQRENEKEKFIKEYREKNIEKIYKVNKEYREKNKDDINNKRNEKIKCECGLMVMKRNIARHRKTKKHNKNIL